MLLLVLQLGLVSYAIGGIDSCNGNTNCFTCRGGEGGCVWSTLNQTCVEMDNDNSTARNDCPLFETWMAWTTPVNVFISCIAASVGLGGGPLFTASFMLLAGMSAQQAVPVTFCAVFGVSIGGWVFVLPATHPQDPSKTLVDFETGTLLSPIVLVGSTVGLLLHLLVPSYVITATLVLVMAFAGWRALKKGLEEFRKTRGSSETKPLVSASASSLNDAAPSVAKTFPWISFLMCLFLWALSCVFLVLRDAPSGEASVIGVICGRIIYWVLFGAFVLALGLGVLIAAIVLHRSYRSKIESSSYKWQPKEIQWSAQRIALWSGVSFVASTLSGFVGIGIFFCFVFFCVLNLHT